MTVSATRPTSSPNPYRGLRWIEGSFGPEAQWTYEPEVSAIERTIQSLRPSETTQVRFLAGGAFSKIYHIQLDGERLIMRVSLPVSPVHKTRSEVATVDWIRRVTDIPTPRIMAHDVTRESEIGFEWILMTEVPGKPLTESWQSMPMVVKSNLIKKFAGFSASLWRSRLKGIGNIYPPPVTVDSRTSATKPTASDSLLSAIPEIGQIVSLGFLWGFHARQDVNRGPFSSSRDWMEARLFLAKNDCHEMLAKFLTRDDLDSDAEDDIKHTTETLALIEKLENIVPRLFPRDEDVPEPSMIFHDDLSRRNILVDEKGELMGVINWECVSTLPLWKACYFPAFLHGRPRDIKPDIESYERGNPPPDTAYWEHLHEYEATLLRSVFLDEMRRLEPRWVKIFDTSHLRRDFDTAVQYVDIGIVRPRIEKWVDNVTAGETPQSLRDSIGC
ncbi:unnamed protein product [Penicillium olsonii]|nr:unnamed protein product [Penicillium olsonii]CAG7928655.1 unnamed protein product [Penicillium olsonii]